MIISHRGYTCQNCYKENSFYSIKTGIEISDGIEFDIRITKDNELIIYHDADINGKLVKDLTFDEILILDRDIILLKTILCILYLYTKKLIMIELKDSDTCQLIEKMLLENGFKNHNIMIITFINNEYNNIKMFPKALLTDNFNGNFNGKIICNYNNISYNNISKNIIGVYTPNDPNIIKKLFDLGLIVITDNPLLIPLDCI